MLNYSQGEKDDRVVQHNFNNIVSNSERKEFDAALCWALFVLFANDGS